MLREVMHHDDYRAGHSAFFDPAVVSPSPSFAEFSWPRKEGERKVFDLLVETSVVVRPFSPNGRRCLLTQGKQ